MGSDQSIFSLARFLIGIEMWFEFFYGFYSGQRSKSTHFAFNNIWSEYKTMTDDNYGSK